MLVQEIPIPFDLVVVELGDEFHMDTSACECSPHCRLIGALAVVEALPCGELRAHGRSDEKHGLLFSDETPRLLALVSAAEVPRLAVVLIDDGEVENKSRGHVSVSSSLEGRGGR